MLSLLPHIFPGSSHGYCLHHLYKNLYKQFKYPYLKTILLRSSTCNYRGGVQWYIKTDSPFFTTLISLIVQFRVNLPIPILSSFYVLPSLPMTDLYSFSNSINISFYNDCMIGSMPLYQLLLHPPIMLLDILHLMSLLLWCHLHCPKGNIWVHQIEVCSSHRIRSTSTHHFVSYFPSFQ